jgi:hypothetical protein
MKRRNFLGILSGAAVTLLRQRKANVLPDCCAWGMFRWPALGQPRNSSLSTSACVNSVVSIDLDAFPPPH